MKQRCAALVFFKRCIRKNFPDPSVVSEIEPSSFYFLLCCSGFISGEENVSPCFITFKPNYSKGALLTIVSMALCGDEKYFHIKHLSYRNLRNAGLGRKLHEKGKLKTRVKICPMNV